MGEQTCFTSNVPWPLISLFFTLYMSLSQFFFFSDAAPMNVSV